MNFAKYLGISFDRTPPDDYFLCLSVNFEKLFRSPFFIEHLWEAGYFMYKLQDFNHQIREKSISQLLFNRFIQEQEVAIQMRSFT